MDWDPTRNSVVLKFSKDIRKATAKAKTARAELPEKLQHRLREGALIGFAGPRVIEQTIRKTLPEGFQRAEFLREHPVHEALIARTHDVLGGA